MFTKLPHVFIVIILSLSFSLQAQNPIWQKVSKNKVSSDQTLERANDPKGFEVFKLNRTALKSVLDNAPLRSSTEISDVIIKFPSANGKLEDFRVVKSPIMPLELADKYQMIKTYKAMGVDDPTATMRFSLTQFGFHGMELSSRGQNMIDPYSKDRDFYMVYGKSSVGGFDGFNCTLEEDIEKATGTTFPNTTFTDTDDSTLRTYELALGCTAAYGNIFANSDPDSSAVENIMAQMVITINRVNEIYERDLAITLEFVPNNDELIFFGSGTDPFEGFNYNASTQTAIDNIIGDANYDIGHSFNTSGGGSAGCIGCVCESGSKGRGFTGSSDPVGDSFYIDFVAHEMGHQFGAFHTMNTCSRSGNGETEVEPASGSSIMGYAGICPVNVQGNSDAHFSFVSVRNITNYVQTNSVNCSDNTDLTNQPPVADAGEDVTIPKSTAFVLQGNATDPDGTESLTYNWAQDDPEAAPGSGSPESTWETGPLYRAISPLESPDRYLPNINTVLGGSLSNTWEVTPSVDREMSFSFIVRDNGNDFANGIGQTDSDLMSITVDGGSGPFTVLSQNEGDSWYTGENRQIEWDVAGTDVAPVDAENLDIKLSTDGGENFDIVLAENTPNDGEQIISVPEGASTENARIMVMASENLFYAVNSSEFSIVETDFVLNFTQLTYEVCQDEDLSIDFNVNFTNDNFDGTVELSTENLPSEISASFDNNTVSEDGAGVSLTLSNFDMADLGDYDFQVIGSSGDSEVSSDLNFSIYNATVIPIQLGQPMDEAEDVDLEPVFSWSSDINVQDYQFELASDENFENLIVGEELTENSFTLNMILDENTTYFWRVKGENPCGTNDFTEASFTTGTCSVCPSSGTTQYDTAITQVIFGDINNSSEKPSGYGDYTDIFTQVELGENYDLSVNVNTGGNFIIGTRVWIDWNQNCSFEETELYTMGAAQNVSDGPTSESPLTVVVPEDAVLGETTMRVSTKYLAFPEACEEDFDGEVEDYTVEVFDDLNVENSMNNDEIILRVYPNPNSGSFKLSLKNSKPQSKEFTIQLFDLQGRKVFDKNYQAQNNFEADINVKKLQAGLYLLKFNSGKITQTEKVVIK